MRGEFLDLDGHRLYCFAAGSRGAGPPIVLVHGAFTSSLLWREVVPRLPPGHRVLVLDLLGHGRSDLPAGAAYDPGAHAERLGALLQVLGVAAACVVGHAAGAAVAVELARREPSRVSHLLLVEPWLVTTDRLTAAVPAAVRRLAALAPLLHSLPATWLGRLLQVALGHDRRRHVAGGPGLDLYLKPYRSAAGRTVAIRQLRALGRRAAAASLTDLTPAPAVALLVARTDPLATANASRPADPAATSHPRWHLESVEAASGPLPEQAPDRVAGAVASLLTTAA